MVPVRSAAIVFSVVVALAGAISVSLLLKQWRFHAARVASLGDSDVRAGGDAALGHHVPGLFAEKFSLALPAEGSPPGRLREACWRRSRFG